MTYSWLNSCVSFLFLMRWPCGIYQAKRVGYSAVQLHWKRNSSTWLNSKVKCHHLPVVAIFSSVVECHRDESIHHLSSGKLTLIQWSHEDSHCWLRHKWGLQMMIEVWCCYGLRSCEVYLMTAIERVVFLQSSFWVRRSLSLTGYSWCSAPDVSLLIGLR